MNQSEAEGYDTNVSLPSNHATSNRKVVVIPATKSLHPDRDHVEPSHQKIRVAAYCRVSTSLEEQQGSYALQKQYYEKLINDNPNWECAGVYGDEGKSGTSMKGRTGFLEMMDDVRAGLIDMIITKATSRFGRNNVEFIEALDELESYGVEVSFESEGIVTSGTNNRTMLQVMGATNEHYSNTLSNNVRWSKERNMKEGKVTICYGNFLGYKKGLDGNPEIVPEEAETVKLIFNEFLTGKSYASIATKLNSEGITTKNQKPWIGEAVKRILINEKYTGDVLLQKTYKKSYLDKYCHKNNGEKPQVLVKNNHEAIIDRETFARAQELISERTKRKTKGTAKSPFVGRIKCNECGEIFGHKTWNSRGNIKYSAWVCRNKYTEETTYSDKKCKTPNLREEWIVNGYMIALSKFIGVRHEYLGRYERKIKRIDHRLEPSGIEKEIRAEDEHIKEIEKNKVSLDQEWELTFGKNEEFRLRQEAIKEEMIEAFRHKKELEEEQASLRARKAELTTFIKTIKALPEQLTKFNDEIFLKTIDYILVKPNSMLYYFYGDEYIRVTLEEAKKQHQIL